MDQVTQRTRALDRPGKAPTPCKPRNLMVESVTLITVTITDGMQMTYVWNLGGFQCTEVKDRNGNKISIAYDSEARLQTIADTLGRP